MLKCVKQTIPVLFLVAAVSAVADEVTDQLDAGAKAYQEQRYQDAITELKFAISAIQEKADKENSVLLPEPLDGWTAEETEADSASMAMLGGGTNMSRIYRRGNEELEIQIVANSPTLQFMLMAINNPMMIQADKTLRPFKYKKIRGTKRVEGNDTEVTLGLAGQIMIQLNGRDLSEESVITDYLDAMDLERIEDALL